MTSKPKLIYVEWEDATSAGGWHTEDEMTDYFDNASVLIKQIGWVYKETARYLFMYSRVQDWDDRYTDGFGQLQKIPKTWIRKRRTIKL